ncbi:MAG: hypothetical protein V4615_12900 [Bacteroidota bacterium]
MKSIFKLAFLILISGIPLFSSAQSKRPVYNPCFLMDSAEKHLEFIKLNASRIFIDTFDCRQMLLDSIGAHYSRTKDKKYLDALTYIRNSSASAKVENLYTDVIRKFVQTDFTDLLNQLYTGKGKYMALEKELIAAMNMIVDGRPFKNKYMGLLNVEISKAKDKKDLARLSYLEKLKTKIENDEY